MAFLDSHLVSRIVMQVHLRLKCCLCIIDMEKKTGNNTCQQNQRLCSGSLHRGGSVHLYIAVVDVLMASISPRDDLVDSGLLQGCGGGRVAWTRANVEGPHHLQELLLAMDERSARQIRSQG